MATLDSVRKVLGNLEEDKLASYSVNDVLNLAKVKEKKTMKKLCLIFSWHHNNHVKYMSITIIQNGSEPGMEIWICRYV